MSSVDVFTDILINCPAAQVSAYAADPDNAPEWYVNIKSAERLADHTGKIPSVLTPGSRISFTAHFLGKKLSYVYEITEFVPGQKLVMRTANGPFPMETIYTWEAIKDTVTRMTLRNRGNPSGFSKLFAPFMALAMKRANRKDLKRIKQLLETGNRSN